jgi:hypothetical protein
VRRPAEPLGGDASTATLGARAKTGFCRVSFAARLRAALLMQGETLSRSDALQKVFLLGFALRSDGERVQHTQG